MSFLWQNRVINNNPTRREKLIAINQTKQWQKRQAEKQDRREQRKKRRQPKRHMSDAARLYRAIVSNLIKLYPHMLEENLITLSMLITGILRSKSGQLKKIARAVQYSYKKESLAERFRRFVRNRNIAVEVEYTPFVTMFLSALSTEPLVLMIDSTKIGGRSICLMVSVYYKSRALPLGWVIFKGRKGHSSQEIQLTLFEIVKSMLPADCPVILLGDGEFDGSQVVQWFEKQPHWHYVCRTDETNLIWYQEQWIALKQLSLDPGQETLLTKVLFTHNNQVGPVNILAVWHETEKRHWFFVTNFDTYQETKMWYKKRFTIETLFSDFKGRGFHLDETRLWIPERVSRLVFAASIAYIFSVVLGVEAIASGDFRQLVRTDAFYHSLFQLGLIYLDHILNECLSFPALINLPPPSSFEHVVISS
jgi:hypothetical protein